jgi:hypothetical protein
MAEMIYSLKAGSEYQRQIEDMCYPAMSDRNRLHCLEG